MLSTINILRLLSLYIGATCVITAEQCGIDIDGFMTRGSRFETPPFWEAKTQDAIGCAQACIRRKICQTFNFNGEKKVCQLHDIPGTPSVKDKKSMYGDVKYLPSQLDPICFGRPCGDDELCIPMSMQTGMSCTYSCFKLARSGPLPTGGSTTQSRTVGSVFTCGPGSNDSDASAICLPNGTWSQSITCEDYQIYGSTYALIPGKEFRIGRPIDMVWNSTVDGCKRFCSALVDCTGFNYCASCAREITCRCQHGSILDSPGILFASDRVDYYNRNCAHLI